MIKFLTISILLHVVVLLVYHFKHYQQSNSTFVSGSRNQNINSINIEKFSNNKSLSFNKKSTSPTLTNQVKNFGDSTHGPVNSINSSKSIVGQKNEDYNAIELIHYVEPVYPLMARKRNFEGKVTLQVDIAPGGEVLHVQVIKSSGFLLLDNAAIDSAKKWQFNSRLESSNVKISKEIVFQLKN